MFRKLFITVAACVLAIPLLAEKIVLAEKSQAKASIVLPVKPSRQLVLAAEDLQLYIKKICGGELPIVNSNKLIGSPAFYIGNASLLPAADRPTAKTHPDAYTIKVDKGNVFIYGRTVTSSSWGVYSLLQETFGVRWFAPTEDWEYVPKSSTPGSLAVDIKDKSLEKSKVP